MTQKDDAERAAFNAWFDRQWENNDEISACSAWMARAALDASAEPVAKFDDPRVQIVYELLGDGQVPPGDEHWDGFVARRIVDALFTRPAASKHQGAESGRAVAEQESLQSLLDDVTAIDTWHRGYPPYEHDANWFKDRVVRLIEQRIEGRVK